MSTKELRRITAVYSERIQAGVIARYSLLRPGELLMAQHRERRLLRLLCNNGVFDLTHFRILEVGCGRGHRLLDCVRWGARPQNLTGVDIMKPLLLEARSNLPAVSFILASASGLPFADAQFDAVTQFTVFSSILDAEMRRAVAQEMWRVLRPGGFVLWYDFRYPNPRNKDVRPVGRREIIKLFPEASINIHSLTLAPPISRALAPWSMFTCEAAALLPFLRTHYAALIRKPARPSPTSRAVPTNCSTSTIIEGDG
jgi:ubiquinone/menaquinone biosynthesis C-methylase UbiE